MSASIELQHTTTKTAKGTIKLTVKTVGTNISNKVFAIEVLPKSADATAPLYRFSHVCSPAELVEFPESTSMGDNCYFRIDEMEMIFDDAKTADRTLYHITTDVQHLVNEYNALDTAQVTSGAITLA